MARLRGSPLRQQQRPGRALPEAAGEQRRAADLVLDVGLDLVRVEHREVAGRLLVGIVLRLPDTDEEPPGDLAVFDPDEIEAYVQDEVGGSALFASRFRECAARALLLPSGTAATRPAVAAAAALGPAAPGGKPVRRLPHRAGNRARGLQDVFDVPGLT